jgi:anti-anti-sigma factor
MADIRLEKKQGGTVIVMSGEMTVEHAAALRDALTGSLETEEQVVVDMDGVTDIDLSCLQLLCSAHRTFTRTSRAFGLKCNCPEVLRQIAGETGYSRNTGCTLETENGCLWKRT